jgi:polyisoprenoid-binding protein YceI
MFARTLLASAAAVLLALPASADDFKLTSDNTKITFTGFKKDGKHSGGFKTVAGKASVPPKDYSKLALELDIDCGSLYTDDDGLTTHLKTPDFFSVKLNPKATFKVTKVENAKEGVIITGDLTLLGKTKPVVAPSTMKMDAGSLAIDSTFKIDRNDWGMSFGKGKIDDLVEVKIAIAAKK